MTPPKDVLRIRMNHCGAGFFAQVVFALNQLRVAEAKGLLPVVDYGRDSMNGDNPFYDAEHGENVWEYFFEPVAGVSAEEARRRAADEGARILSLTYWELWRVHWGDPESVFTYPYGHYAFVDDRTREYDAAWWASQRARARRLVERYVRVRPEILAKVEAFAKEHFTTNMLGVHARGTDKSDVGAGPKLSRIVPPGEYYPHIDRYLDAHEGCRIFFATDQTQFRQEMQARYGERIVSYAQHLSRSKVNVFQMKGGARNYQKGEEVLIDALLLARCDYLFKCTSSVGEFAMYFSPSLECFDLNFAPPPAGHVPKSASTSRLDRLTGSRRALHAWFFVLGLNFVLGLKSRLGLGIRDERAVRRPRWIVTTNYSVDAPPNET